MNSYTYTLDKLPTSLISYTAHYFMKIREETLDVNTWVGREVSIEFTGRLQCLDCRNIVKKFYAPGLCYTCMIASPMNSDCIVRPELCEAHLGKGKVPEWEAKHHFQPHIVYLANSGGLKVGVTRTDQIPTRWIDQGADQAIILALTPYRQLAGQIEVALKDYLSDKTNWRTMLKNELDLSIDLRLEKQKYAELIDGLGIDFGNYIAEDDTVYSIQYPTTTLTSSIQSIKLDKQAQIKGILTGIKGQYLIFDEKTVFNMRSHGGYEVKIQI